MLAKVGINWQVDLLDPVAISDRMKNLTYDMMGLYWMWIWDPDLMPTGLYHPDGGFNYGRYDNKVVTDLILKGREEVDLIKRQKIYHDLEKVLYDDYSDIWAWWAVSVVAYSKNVKGINMDWYMKGWVGFYFSHPYWFKDGKP